MLFPWYATTMLAIEASGVVALRFIRLAAGGWGAIAEAELMVCEKVDALVEAGGSFLGGGTPAMVVSGYRERVAANEARLGMASQAR